MLLVGEEHPQEVGELQEFQGVVGEFQAHQEVGAGEGEHHPVQGVGEEEEVEHHLVQGEGEGLEHLQAAQEQLWVV